MSRLPPCALLAMLIPAFAGPSAMPVIAENPHVLFLKSWLDPAKPAGEHTLPPARFRFADNLADAVRDQDRALVRELLPLYSQAIESEIQLCQIELSTRSQLAERARQVADQLRALVSLLGERPAAGTLGQIERESLAAAALPFEIAAAENLAKLPPLRRRLELLGAKKNPIATAIPDPPLPISTDASSLAASSPVLRILDLLNARRLALLEPLDQAAPAFEPLFLEEKSVPGNKLTRLGRADRFSSKIQADTREDALFSLTEAIQRRLDAIAALQPLVRAFPEDKLARMLAAAELADRQYRQGAIPISLLIETQKAVFEARNARTDALLNLWRETMELRSLAPAPKP